MKALKRRSMRALYKFACIMGGWFGHDLGQVLIIAVVTLPSCYIFLLSAVVLSH